MEWSSKERLILLSNLLEFGEQTESWTRIARAFQTKKDTRYSSKVRLRRRLAFSHFLLLRLLVVSRGISSVGRAIQIGLAGRTSGEFAEDAVGEVHLDAIEVDLPE